jgi:hypothetical protein
MSFANVELDANYRRLGFVPDGFGMKLKIGNVELVAVEYPLSGVALFFTGVGRRTATQFEIALPVSCPPELIAGMIYVNFAKSFHEDAASCKEYLRGLKIPLFQ